MRIEPLQKLKSLALWREALLAGGLAFVLLSGSLIVRGVLTAPTTDFNEQYRISRYIAHGRGMVCPVGPERDDPSSWYTPGYVGIISGAHMVFGEDSPAARATIRLTAVAAQAAGFAFFFALARIWLGRRPAWIALAAMVFSPVLLFKADEIWDTHWLLLAGAAVMFLYVARPPKRWPAVLAGGIGCGIAALINPAFTLCYPVWILYAWWKTSPHSFGSAARYVGVTLAGFVVTIAPWTIRNYVTFGQWFYMRGNLHMELRAGNMPQTDGHASSGRSVHPVFNEHEARRMVEMGEWNYFRSCGPDVRDLLAEDKARLAKLTLNRIGWFWFGRYDLQPSLLAKAILAIGYAVPAALAMLSMGILLVWDRRWWPLIATAMIFPLPYYFTQIMVRYRLAIEPVLLLLIVAAVTVVHRRLTNPRSAPRP